MKKKNKRDLEKAYPKEQFIAKLRRLADTLEAEERFSIQIAGERLFVPKNAIVNIEHEREGQWEEVEFQIKWKRGKFEGKR
jgi:amphi-Trp domain-containing protein